MQHVDGTAVRLGSLIWLVEQRSKRLLYSTVIDRKWFIITLSDDDGFPSEAQGFSSYHLWEFFFSSPPFRLACCLGMNSDIKYLLPEFMYFCKVALWQCLLWKALHNSNRIELKSASESVLNSDTVNLQWHQMKSRTGLKYRCEKTFPWSGVVG